MLGDSTVLQHSQLQEVQDTKVKFALFMNKLQSFARGDPEVFPFTMILRDPLGNSFISAPLGNSLSII